jgi:hypothetical protein
VGFRGFMAWITESIHAWSFFLIALTRSGVF